MLQVVKKTLADRFHGKPCPYCKRDMDRADFDLTPTRDHYPIPKSKGGARTVIACQRCNNVKGDMLAPEWEAYMLANPDWFIVTDRDRRARRAANREAERTAKWGPRGARVIRQAETPSTPMADVLAHHRPAVEAHHRLRNEARPKKPSEPLMALKLAQEIGREFDRKFGGD